MRNAHIRSRTARREALCACILLVYFNSQLLYCVVLCCESEVSQWLPDFVVGYHGEEGPSVNLHVQTDHVACLEQTYSE